MAAFVPLPLLSFNRLMEAALDSGLLALDYALVPLRSALWVWLVTGLVVGVALLPALLFKPTRLVPQPGRVVSVFSRSLRARFMVVILPLLVIGIILSILAVSSRALTLARQQALDEMARSAQNAGDGIVNFYYRVRICWRSLPQIPVFLSLNSGIRSGDRSSISPLFPGDVADGRERGASCFYAREPDRSRVH